MATLMNDVGSFLSPDLLSRLGGAIGESPDTANRAAHAGLPALVDGLRDVARTEGGGARILEVIRGRHYDEPGALSRIESMSRDPSATAQLAPEGQGVLRSIFGGHLDGVVSRLHQSSGVDRPAIGGMLALLAPVVLGVLGKKAREDHLDDRGITKLLTDERSIPGAIGAGVDTHEANRVHVFDRPERRAAAAVPTREEHRRPNWLLPLLALALLALALFFLFRGRDDDRRAVVVPETRVEEPVPAAPPVVAPTERESAGKPQAAEPTTADLGADTTQPTGTPQELGAAAMPHGAIEEGLIEQGAMQPGAIEQGAMQAGAMQQGAIEQGALPESEPLAEEGMEPMAEETLVEEELIAAPEGGIDAFASALTSEEQTLPARFVVDDLQFASGAIRLGTDVASIDRLAELLQQSPEARIRIDGHTDSNGSDELNRDLSLARADAVRAALVERGIEEDRIETRGEGEDQPIASNDTEEGQRQNRRTEVVLLER